MSTKIVVYGWTTTHPRCGELHLDVCADRTARIYAASLAANSLGRPLSVDERLDVMIGPLTSHQLTLSKSYLEEFCLDVARVPDFVYDFMAKLKVTHDQDLDTLVTDVEDAKISAYVNAVWDRYFYVI